ncbi:MAG: diguanylate cyclase [Oleiphilaceae bacterium]|nr:diguanylate cyclase [Oleiphilaceae bacterium]
MTRILHLLASLLAFAAALFSHATIAENLRVQLSEATTYPVYIGSRMQFIEDPEHALSLDDVAAGVPWQVIRRESPNFGFTPSAFWFRFEIYNDSEQARNILIELPIPFLDDVRLYRMEGSSAAEQHLVGDRYPFSHRPIKHNYFVMPFTLDAGSNIFLMRVAAAGSIEAPMYIWEPDTFAIENAEQQLIQGIWIGIIGIMVIYNLFLYFSIRDPSYLYYVGFAFGYLMFQISLKGYGFAYLWPNQIEWNSFCISTFIAIAAYSAARMISSFLNLKENSPLGHKAMLVFAVFSGVILMLTFVLPYTLTIRITSVMTGMVCLFSLWFGYLMWWRGDHYARYFCLAWTSAFGGIGILTMQKFGIIPSNFWTHNAGQIGVMMLVALLSLALANRINREKELRLEAQESSLEHEKLARKSQEDLLKAKENANLELERKVAERTDTLERALTELEKVNGRLEILSTTDALTTLYNRGHFENRLEIEFKRAQRHQRDLSVILCDLDYFKVINDTYGHKAGDECLRQVSLIFKNRLNRSGDLIARYGGEEFIILLADTSLEDASQIAKSLCREVREMDLQSQQHRFSVTASFGVASIKQSDISSAEELVHNADMALYRAKHGGRDQVVIWQHDAPLMRRNSSENV